MLMILIKKGVILMVDYDMDENYMVKLVSGVVIGLLLIFLVVPLAADAIATQSVANAANDALQEMNNSDVTLPSTATDVIQSVSQENNTNSNKTASLINTDNSNQKNTSQDDKLSPIGMTILSGTITTGSSLSSKSECTIFVGKEYAGVDIQMSTLYSRDGKDLNAGRLVEKKVDSNGYVTLKAADSYSLYPDECLISIYDMEGNELDYRIVYLETESGTQSF